jgi:glycosyltransferase involved in cell wall biosynthesis
MKHLHRNGRRLRIAQVAPLFESVPPQGYGGTERVASYLSEELVRLGHDVTLFASGDSVTAAKLVPCSPRSLRLDPGCRDQLAHHFLMLERVCQMAARFDILHFHIDYLHYPLSRRLKRPHVTTLHGRLDLPDLQPLYDEFSDVPVISISDEQRRPLPQANWQTTVYHGLPPDLHTFREKPEGYLAFLGRISPEKRPDRAIEIAVATGMKLRIAAKVDKADREYYETEIRPLMEKHADQVEFLGEVNGKPKDEFLGNAAALLFPIDWPEPFGLVMIEAMACGTPVIAYRRGSVPEVLEHGVTGYLVENQEEAVEAVRNLSKISRAGCRAMFEKRFVAERMARDYLDVYYDLIERRGQAARLSRINYVAPMDGKKSRPRRPGGSPSVP